MRFDGFTADDFVRRPIPAFDQHIRQNLGDQTTGIRLIEEDDIIDAGQRRKHFSALLLRHDRPVRSLVQASHRLIGIDTDDEKIAEAPGGLQITSMADMHQIETAVGKDDTVALLPPCGERRDGFMSADDFLVHRPS